MTDSEKAAQVMATLKAAEREPTQTALPMLNGLAGLIQGGGEAPLEVEEARSGAFMAICEIGKALHRGQPADVGAGDLSGATVDVVGELKLVSRSLRKSEGWVSPAKPIRTKTAIDEYGFAVARG